MKDLFCHHELHDEWKTTTTNTTKRTQTNRANKPGYNVFLVFVMCVCERERERLMSKLVVLTT